MPKVVDHEARRASLAQAVWRVALERGLDDATVREISAEAGWSTGVLSHYFSDKDELMRFAFRLVVERAAARYATAIEEDDDPALRIRHALRESLPLDDERRAEARVWLAFLGRSLAHPDLAGDRKNFYAGWRDSLARLLEDGRAAGALRADVDAEAEADALIALVDGLALQAVSDPDALPSDRQEQILDAALERLSLPSNCYSRSSDLEEQRVALPAAGADRGEAEPTAVAAELVDHGADDAGARRADRVAERDGAAVHVHLLGVGAEHLQPS